MRRWFGAVPVLVSVAAILVPVATASKPVIEPLPADDFTIPADICGFDVAVNILANKSKAIMFGDGHMMITGSLKARLTNVEEQTRSIVLNIPGPGRFDERGLTATGPWLFFFLPDELGEGSPGILAYTTGRARIDDAGFHLLGGRRTDLCPLLAAT